MFCASPPLSMKAKEKKKLSEMTVDELRSEYKFIRQRSEADGPEAFDAAVKKLLADKKIENPSPAQYVKAARLVRFKCGRCGGTGRFITGSLNGQLVGPGGHCYRCAGKGTQDDADVRRNFGADNHQIVRAFRAMTNGGED